MERQKYKELFIESTKRYINHSRDLESKISDIGKTCAEIPCIMKGRRDEISSELYKDIMDKINEVSKIVMGY